MHHLIAESFALQMALERTFDDQLRNKSSPEWHVLAKAIVEEV